MPGYKYNMTDVEAAIGLCQLDRLGEFLYLRRKYAAYYREALGEVEGLRLLAPPDEGHSHHLFIVLVQPEALGIDRDGFVAALRQENIGTGIHFRPVHRMQYYRERYASAHGALPVAEEAGERLLSLPMYPKMSFEQVERVADAVRKLARHFRARRLEA
jgi:dTDP-4-amino-4,6-dideoxygalactose transaminase